MQRLRRQFPPRTLLLVGALLLLVSGCGGPRTNPVTGRVVYPDGSPMLSGLVIFEAVDTEKPMTATGVIQRDGSFRLKREKGRDGAVEGRHRIIIASAHSPPRMQKDAVPISPIHERYARFETSGLEYTVKSGTNEVTFTVEKPSSRRVGAPKID